jgi:hypothetical protein
MSRLGGESLVVLKEKLSPHLEKASALLASFPIFERQPIELEPEERLAVYVRLRQMRRKMGLPEPEEPAMDEGKAGHASDEIGGQMVHEVEGRV